eukprot:CAMPEP_0113682180 /NCGR_PEP_ID=MMETSP0038_2-20120614/12486_1 /TAXON_ID=2898 /ORGANISM="Cryptomonas paramecium" /LENGTH=415 /DNA_ID=CAMNT_0000601153 /DNA_START=638 /DNA_END=1882 /DNA_ORIENTATION=- /assembly_acc=CAM_ASM_000170
MDEAVALRAGWTTVDVPGMAGVRNHVICVPAVPEPPRPFFETADVPSLETLETTLPPPPQPVFNSAAVPSQVALETALPLVAADQKSLNVPLGLDLDLDNAISSGWPDEAGTRLEKNSGKPEALSLRSSRDEDCLHSPDPWTAEPVDSSQPAAQLLAPQWRASLLPMVLQNTSSLLSESAVFCADASSTTANREDKVGVRGGAESSEAESAVFCADAPLTTANCEDKVDVRGGAESSEAESAEGADAPLTAANCGVKVDVRGGAESTEAESPEADSNSNSHDGPSMNGSQGAAAETWRTRRCASTQEKIENGKCGMRSSTGRWRQILSLAVRKWLFMQVVYWVFLWPFISDWPNTLHIFGAKTFKTVVSIFLVTWKNVVAQRATLCWALVRVNRKIVFFFWAAAGLMQSAQRALL